MNIEGIRSIGSSYVPAVTQNSAVPAGSRTPDESSPKSVVIPYLSPALRYDSDAGVAVLLFRDGNSGEVELQYPSRQVVREYQLRGRESMRTPDGSGGDGGKGERANNLLSLARAGVSTVTSTTAPSSSTPAAASAAATGTPAAATAPASTPSGASGVGGSVNFIA